MSYLDELGSEIERGVPPELVPANDSSALFRLYAVLAFAKGTSVDAPDVHNAWAAWMQERDPDHRALKPFEQLDRESQVADEPFVRAIRAAAARLL
jgi:hypothetical protein